MRNKDFLSKTESPNQNERRNFVSKLFFGSLGFLTSFLFKGELIGLHKVDAATLTDESSISQQLEQINQQLSQSVTNGNGTKTKVVAGVIRNTGKGFDLINDGYHPAINIGSITTDSEKIRVKYSFTGSNTGVFLANPDETLAQKGFSIGCSVTQSYADIQFSKTDMVSGYITKSGGSTPVFIQNTSYSKGITKLTWDSSQKQLQITHEKCYSTTGIIAFTRKPDIQAFISSFDFNGGSNSYIQFYQDGNLITPPDGTVLVFNRVGAGIVPPQDVIYSGSNIWLLGLMPVSS